MLNKITNAVARRILLVLALVLVVIFGAIGIVGVFVVQVLLGGWADAVTLYGDIVRDVVDTWNGEHVEDGANVE